MLEIDIQIYIMIRYVDSILEEHKDHIINDTDETENKWCI
jgi:hypothetical protein